MKTSKPLTILIVAIVFSVGAAFWYFDNNQRNADLTILISPYQDLAMYINVKPLGLEEKYGTTIEFLTIPWEETFLTILSANSPADLAFASYADFLTKKTNMNRNNNDPLLFIFPAYIFKGGAFITFKDGIDKITNSTINNPDIVKKFLSHRLGFPAKTLYEMIISDLTSRAGMPMVKFIDVSFDAGLLAAKNGDLDIAAVGLTQLTAARNEGGHSVLDMETLGFADITGFIARKSVLENKRKEIMHAIKMWFDCVQYVLSDIDQNSKDSLVYLQKNAAVKYSLRSYKLALQQEYFPMTVSQVYKDILSRNGKYYIGKIHKVISGYLLREKIVLTMPKLDSFDIVEMDK